MFETLKNVAKNKMNIKKQKEKSQLINKYNRLANIPTSNINSKAVKNISDRTLDDQEMQVLSKGLNFATDHTDQDVLQFIAQIEPIIEDIKNINSEEKSTIRSQIVSSLKHSKKLNNLTYHEKQAIKRLKNDNNITIAKADKGNITVVLNKSDYEQKIKEHLDNEIVYEKLDQDTTKQIQQKLNNFLMKLKKKKSITQQEYEKLYSNTCIAPVFYALIKTHKENFPIRPIVSFVGSPTYESSKLLSKIISPLTNLADQKLKNTMEAKQSLENLIIPDDHILVSFDVKQLFTSVPLDLALSCVDEIIESNRNLFNQSTTLEPEEVTQLLKICLDASVFKWKDSYYK